MITTPVKICRIEDTELCYQRAAERCLSVIREAGEPMVVKCSPSGMIYVDSIHNGTDPRLTIIVVDTNKKDRRPMIREHNLEEEIRAHAQAAGFDTGVRRGRFKGR